MSSSNNIVPPKGKYTRRMAAEEIGRSSDTLRRWQREGLCEPSSSMQAGQLTVWLYTKRDLKRLERRRVPYWSAGVEEQTESS